MHIKVSHFDGMGVDLEDTRFSNLVGSHTVRACCVFVSVFKSMCNFYVCVYAHVGVHSTCVSACEHIRKPA